MTFNIYIYKIRGRTYLHSARAVAAYHKIVVAGQEATAEQLPPAGHQDPPEQRPVPQLPQAQPTVPRTAHHQLVARRYIEVADSAATAAAAAAVGRQREDDARRLGVQLINREPAVQRGGDEAVGVVVRKHEVGDGRAVKV